MNIAIVIRGIGDGGLGISALNQARMLATQKHKVYFVTGTTGERLDSEKDFGIYHVSDRLTCRSLCWSLLARLKVPGINISSVEIDNDKFAFAVNRCLARLIASEKIEAVIFRESFGAHLYWKRSRSCRAIIGFHGPVYMFQHMNILSTPINKWFHKIDRNVVDNADGLYTPSHNMKNLAAGYYEIAENRITVLPNAVDTNEFCPPEKAPAVRTILFVGRISREKGAELLLKVIPDILTEFNDVKFAMSGRSGLDGHGRKYADLILERAEGIGCRDRINWIRLTPNIEIHKLYRKCSILVLPTLYNNFPNVCLEAQASGLPVVASDIGGVPEIVDHNTTGILFPVNNDNEFKKALTRLLEDEEERKAMGLAARDRVIEKWSLDALAPDFADFIQNAVRTPAKKFIKTRPLR